MIKELEFDKENESICIQLQIHLYISYGALANNCNFITDMFILFEYSFCLSYVLESDKERYVLLI